MTGQRASLLVASWNVDGLTRYLPEAGMPGRPAPLEYWWRQMGSPDVVCLQEVQLRPQDTNLVRAAAAALPGFGGHLALNEDPFNGRFRGGRTYGVATYVRADISHSARRLDDDREGRVLIVELPRWRLAIFNIYGVNGTNRPWFDASGRKDGDRHLFKRALNARIAAAALQAKSRGLDLILIGDWNVAPALIDSTPRLRTEPPHALARRMLNDDIGPMLGVVDVFRERHPDARRYTWRARGQGMAKRDAARVDFALVTRALLPHVLQADVCDDRTWGASDHVPVTVSLRDAARSAM